ncbi:MAG: DMT family transporter [Deltaproteobacteria bacterium]|nr:DMT family transporter [Deltaproteobacteria bacterium]
MRLSGPNVAALLVAVVLVWGVNWTVIKVIVSLMPPIWAMGIRAIIAAAALFALQAAGRNLSIPTRRDLPAIVIVAVFHMVLFAVFIAIGLQYVSVGRSVVLGYTTPLWVAPFAWLFLKEPMPPAKILGVLVGLTGLAVLLNPLALDWNDPQALIGTGVLLLAALSWAVSMLCVRAITWHSTPFQLAPWQNLLASLIMLAAARIIEGPLDVEPSWLLAAATAYNGLVATAFGFWAVTVVNTYYTATTTSLVMLATPVVGALSSLIMLGEPIDLPLIIAGGMIIVGIALGTAGKSGR